MAAMMNRIVSKPNTRIAAHHDEEVEKKQHKCKGIASIFTFTHFVQPNKYKKREKERNEFRAFLWLLVPFSIFHKCMHAGAAAAAGFCICSLQSTIPDPDDKPFGSENTLSLHRIKLQHTNDDYDYADRKWTERNIFVFFFCTFSLHVQFTFEYVHRIKQAHTHARMLCNALHKLYARWSLKLLNKNQIRQFSWNYIAS